MPPPYPRQYTPSNLKSLHLLRALLRETTYLPDANARSFFHRYIITRFKTYQPRECAVPTNRLGSKYKRRPTSVIEARTPDVQRKAHKALNYLRRANTGEPTSLWKVLLFTYGRLGPRRYKLMQKILVEDVPDKEGLLPPLQRMYYSGKGYLQFFDAPMEVKKKANETSKHSISISKRYPRLRAVLASQLANEVSLGPTIKQGQLITPVNNVWERPMPVRRARNDVKRWYARTMARILPPLPTREWEELEFLAMGIKRWTDFVPRRTYAGKTELSEEERSMKIIQEGLWLERPSKADRPGGRIHPHALTPRMMKRLYARLFALSCRLAYNEKSKKWVAHWGVKQANKQTEALPQSVSDLFFSGVDTKGRILQQPPPAPPRQPNPN
ncbi:hypothetical protein BU24DRAFT_463059 [Aaosphaeria arxii CBS 175.79]|uniref:LYR motif-containing protein Cup1-like N-terminal domain-containing protein n=1 Tax=Aaosphaeria arxii CBS 175.79 TaxID=1450172 RepID=A0A6A5XPH9_9PLEO|nr:uncharacterized protein BU24DRAFT_463059 [Aaosphaeria arxii CBS 175.79]KAF2014254.1 hypothetical protein BU24DRAFT_463059 [Aaosphaeria arxii CBS 175.79]